MKGVVVTDTFTRTLANGWGSADTGQAWSVFYGGAGTYTATDTSTNGTTGLHSVPSTNAYRASYLGTFAQTYADVAVDASVAVMPVGGPLELGNLMTRGTSITTYCLFRVQISPAGVVSAVIFSSGGTNLGTVTIPNITYTAGMVLRIRAQSIGQVHRIKVWPVANPEPVAWPLTVVDSTAVVAGWVGVRSGVASGVTNALPVTFTYDNFKVAQVPDFPNDVLPLTVLAAFGADLSKDPSTWAWTNITADVRGGSVVITPGRADETSQAPSASCAFDLNNFSMAYSANNPASPNYPNVRRNTPIWVIIDPATRFFGYANGFPPSWDTSGKMPIVKLTASGSLRRWMQGKSPVQSPLYRAISARPELRAYWTMEDAVTATTAASALPGGQPATVAGMTFAADATEPGSAPVVKLGPTTGGPTYLSAQVSGSFTGHWQVDWYYKFPTDPTPNEVKIMSIFTSDVSGASGIHWDIAVGAATPNVMTVYASNFAGTSLVNSPITVGTAYFGQWVHARLMAQQSGGNIQWQIVIFPPAGNGTFWNGTIAGTIGGVFALTIPQMPTSLNGLAMGHLAVFDAWNLGAADQAQSGFAGELVTDRLKRLCADRGVPLAITGTSTTTMGPQGIDTFVNLLRECEAADGGLLYDGFGPGLGYVCRAARYNLPAALTLDMAAGQVDDPFQPADDDQRNRNLVTVSRKGGSSATAQDSTGPLGTAAIGTYESTPSAINVSTDDVLPNFAAWAVHMGTAEGFRYPNLKMDLGANPALIDGWSGAPLNSRLDVLNVASATGHVAGTVSVLDEGYTETLTPKGWKVTANCSPYGPWLVFVLGTDRLQGSGATVPAGAAAGAVSLSVAIAAGNPLWITTANFPSMFPFDINVGGWQVTVTGITGTASPQTFTVNATPGTIPANATVTLWQPRVLAL